MASTWTSGSAMQWNQQEGGFQSSSPFTFVDFLPDCSEKGGFFKQPKMESFRTLVDRGNDWLRANGMWKVVTCESVEFRARGTYADSNTMLYIEYGESHTTYIRGLRLWLEKRKDGDTKYQQIGYMNILPDIEKKGGIFRLETYDTLDDVISRFNSSIQMHPIPGRIITIETQEMKSYKLSTLDPDKTRWSEDGDRLKHYIFVIRIFFELSEGMPEEIGLADFLPEVIEKGGLFSFPKYEPFSNVIRKASDWCALQRNIRFCNAQSVEIRLKRGSEVNSRIMSYTESGNISTFYVRILRIAYTRSYLVSPDAFRFTCKTFVPVQLKSNLCPAFENLSQTKFRVEEWLKATGAQVVSVETLAMRWCSGGERKNGAEASFTYNMPERNEWFIFVIRVYLNGIYREPPPELLSPIPEIEQNCCNLM